MLTVKEAEADWRELADRAEAGEAVTITRENDSRLQLRALPVFRRGMTEEEWFAWFDAHTAPLTANATDVVSLVRRMRGYDD